VTILILEEAKNSLSVSTLDFVPLDTHQSAKVAVLINGKLF
jgi:hypothetical protein